MKYLHQILPFFTDEVPNNYSINPYFRPFLSLLILTYEFQVAGVSLTPLDDKDTTFTMSVQRLKRSSTSITPLGKSKGSSRPSTPAVDDDVFDGCCSNAVAPVSDAVSDVRQTKKEGAATPSFPKSSSGRSTPTSPTKGRNTPTLSAHGPSASKTRNITRKSSVRSAAARSNLKGAQSESNLSPCKSSECGVKNASSVPDLDTRSVPDLDTQSGNIEKKSMKPRRVSLMDRQDKYAQKRRSMVDLSTASES